MLFYLEAPDPLNAYKFLVSLATLFIGLAGGVVALITFRRTEKWKRAEFIADEMKEFFADDRVKKTLLMIDWGVRKIQLLPTTPSDDGMVVVDRLLQARALRPHEVESDVVQGDNAAWETDATREHPDDLSRFSPAEVAIRDCYDGFLDGLAKFASYIETSLVEPEVLETYIRYWLKSIAEPTQDSDDAAWKASLLTYISFYEYNRVILLFEKFGYNINPGSDCYTNFLKQIKDQNFASALALTVKQKFSYD